MKCNLCSLVIVLFLIGCDGYDIVMSGLSQASANEALVLLREHHIDASKDAEPSKKIASFTIKVKREQSLEALRILVDNRIPRTERASLKDIYPPGSSGIIPTKGEEHARFLMASQGEVEALFKIIPGITDARVVLSFDPPNEIRKNPVAKTASLVLLYQARDDGSLPISDSDAKNLIASSINGLLADDVTVVQKAITTVVPTKIAELTPPIIAVAESDDKNLIWYMLGLTVLALLVALYGIIRLFVHKRPATLAS